MDVSGYVELYEAILLSAERSEAAETRSEAHEVAKAILAQVGADKRQAKIPDRKNQGNQSEARPGVREFLKKNRDKNDFLADLYGDIQKYGRLTKAQYKAIKGEVKGAN